MTGSVPQRCPSDRLPLATGLPAHSQLVDRLQSSKQSSCSGRAERLRSRGTAVDDKPLAGNVPEKGRAKSSFMQERMEFLEEDLSHLFDERGLDQSQYDDKVNFMDPLTKFSSVKGYMFNIAMLKRLFAPDFQLHDIRQTGDYEITTRWTMIMQFTLNRISPLRRFWDPKLIFTGVSIMGINKENGKVNAHIDLWDAVKNNKWFSLEAASHVGGQMTSLMRSPDLDSFSYTILRKTKDYEIRRFEPFQVIEAQIDSTEGSSDSGSGQKDPAARATGAFRALVGFLTGNNKSQEKYKMTMPVLTDTGGTMRFILPLSADSKSIPEPSSSEVKTSRQPGGLWAARTFSGAANTQTSQQQADLLRQALLRAGLKPNSEQWVLARYNDPSTRPLFRRNEVLMPVDGFSLWGN
ncbi:hypothetical protein WJX73_010820 [Symbiochloris irregularis]|uniref:SOUL heme-binding protein n=1 Tax=Symbiochloris irregularis TaxID=706552 RepID=A0AAW1P7Y0_9CHLO